MRCKSMQATCRAEPEFTNLATSPCEVALASSQIYFKLQ